jgi:hypothetical protein
MSAIVARLCQCHCFQQRLVHGDWARERPPHFLTYAAAVIVSIDKARVARACAAIVIIQGRRWVVTAERCGIVACPIGAGACNTGVQVCSWQCGTDYVLVSTLATS